MIEVIAAVLAVLFFADFALLLTSGAEKAESQYGFYDTRF